MFIVWCRHCFTYLTQYVTTFCLVISQVSASYAIFFIDRFVFVCISIEAQTPSIFFFSGDLSCSAITLQCFCTTVNLPEADIRPTG